jgi:hypothetical protein
MKVSAIFGAVFLLSSGFLKAEVRVAEQHRFIVTLDEKEGDVVAESFGVNSSVRGQYKVFESGGLAITVDHLTSASGSGIPTIKNDAYFVFDAKSVRATDTELSASLDPKSSRKLYDALKGIKGRDLGQGDFEKVLNSGGLYLNCKYSKRGFLPYECEIVVNRQHF